MVEHKNMFVASHTNATTMKKYLLILGIVCLITTSSFAQSEQKESKYAIETDILWPFLVQTTRTHFTVKLWEKGNLRGDAYVGFNDLQALLDLCRIVIIDKSKAEQLLPSTSGFFFGNTEYDEWYYNDIQNTIEILEKAVEDKDGEYYYSSSW